MAWLVERAAPQHGHGPPTSEVAKFRSRILLISLRWPCCLRICARWKVWIWGSKCRDKGPNQIRQWTASSNWNPSLPVLFSRGVFESRLSLQVGPSNQSNSHVKPISLATKLNAPYVASGCEEHAQKGRFASFCTTSRRTLMWLVSLPQWAALTWARVLLLVSRQWTNSRLLIIPPETPEDVVGIIMGGISVRPRLTKSAEGSSALLRTKMFCFLLQPYPEIQFHWPHGEKSWSNT